MHIKVFTPPSHAKFCLPHERKNTAVAVWRRSTLSRQPGSFRAQHILVRPLMALLHCNGHEATCTIFNEVMAQASA